MGYCVVAAVNNDVILAQNLADSPMLLGGMEFIAQRDYSSATVAYNSGLDATASDVIIFAHQDVYFPQPWFTQLQAGIRAIEQTDDKWGVIGVYGVTDTGSHFGHCWSSGLGTVLGGKFTQPQQVVSIDELVIILRRSSGLRFDENLPGFHLYGTDIVKTSLASGSRAYVIHAPVVHNSNPVETLSGAYSDAYRYMQGKWKESLPVPTTVVPVTRFGYPLMRYKLRRALKRMLLLETIRTAGPREFGRNIALRLGFEMAVQERSSE